MKRKRIYFLEASVIILISIAMTCVTTIRLFVILAQVPRDHIVLGMIHYFEDYYYYLDQFYQGAHGSWLTVNNFTSENFAPTLIYFSNIIMGKIGGVLGLESYTTYTFFLLILKFIFLVISYIIILYVFPTNRKYRITTFLMYIFSTSMPIMSRGADGSWGVFGPSRVFQTENIIMARFGNIPDRFLSNILFLLAIIVIYNLIYCLNNRVSNLQYVAQKKAEIRTFIKYSLIMTIIIFPLTISDAVKSLIVYLTLIFLILIVRPAQNFKRYLAFIAATIAPSFLTFFVTGLYLVKTINSDPVYLYATQWDIDQYFLQFKLFGFNDFVTAFGALGILTVIGLVLNLSKKRNIMENIAYIIIILTLLGYFIPPLTHLRVPGFKFEFKSTYLFMAIIGFHVFLSLEQLLRKKILIIFLIIYLSINLTTFRLSIRENLKPVEAKYNYLDYMHKDFYKGLIYLRNVPKNNTVILSPPDSSVDLFIPGFTGKKTYSGHVLVTYKTQEKDKNAREFFDNSRTFPDPEKFLQANNIGFIMFTRYDNWGHDKPWHVEKLLKDYPFLKKEFENDEITVFRVEITN